MINEITKRPIIGARVMTSSSVTFTSASGNFSLVKVQSQDTIMIRHLGYEPYSIKLIENMKYDTLVILLKSRTIVLQEVNIIRTHNHKLDSVKYRKEFNSVFSYKNPILKDIFITKSPSATIGKYSPFQNATSTLASINILSAIRFLSKNKAPISKLQKRILEEEEFNYVDRMFSKEKIRSVTSLSGDSLQYFINEYRPSIEATKKMNDYQLILYIKKSYDDFIKSYKYEEPSL